MKIGKMGERKKNICIFASLLLSCVTAFVLNQTLVRGKRKNQLRGISVCDGVGRRRKVCL